MDILRRNGLAVAGTVFQKMESHKIINMSGLHRAELDLLVVRQHQFRMVKDCIALAGEYVTTQQKPIVVEVRMKKWKEKRAMGLEELYRNLDEDGGKHMIFKTAWNRTEDGRDVNRGAVIKDNNGRLITESKKC